MNGEEIYINRGRVTSENPAQDCTEYECCTEELVFAMKDKYHEFSVGLTTILHCLAIAEAEGYVPKIDTDWWIMVKNRH